MLDYEVIIHGRCIDISDILKAYKITDPNISNVIELLLMVNKRRLKSKLRDALEAKEVLERYIEEQNNA